MNKKVVMHVVGLALTGVIGGLVDYFTGSHYVWAPVAVAILTDIKPLLAAIGSQAAPPPAK